MPCRKKNCRFYSKVGAEYSSLVNAEGLRFKNEDTGCILGRKSKSSECIDTLITLSDKQDQALGIACNILMNEHGCPAEFVNGKYIVEHCEECQTPNDKGGHCWGAYISEQMTKTKEEGGN